MVKHTTHNGFIIGSNPIKPIRGYSLMEELILCKYVDIGSNPIISIDIFLSNALIS